MISAFIQRNALSVRMASNIKRSRSSVDKDDVMKFFDNIIPALLESNGDHIYNYDETNVTDDPGARKVIVSRNCKRVERVQNFSRATISIMVCGSASGTLLPPMVVYKAGNVYENWCRGGPPGTVYRNSPSGWFDANLFEVWFHQILLPHIVLTREPGKRVIVVGDNLASHFAPSVVQAAEEHNIYMTPFPANATHLMQPLDVAVFGPMKKKWRAILENWRTESRYPGSIPKEQFPTLLSRLWVQISDTISQNLISGFRATGLYPCNPQEVLKRLPDATVHEEQIGRALDASLVELLQEHRGVQDPAKKRKRGKKVEPGKRVSVAAMRNADVNSVTDADKGTPNMSVSEDVDNPQPTTSQENNKMVETKKMKNIATSPKKDAKLRRSSRERSDSNKCGICRCLWENYNHRIDWIRCCKCQKWICGMCNGDSKESFFICATCDDDSDEPDPYETDEEEDYVPSDNE